MTMMMGSVQVRKSPPPKKKKHWAVCTDVCDKIVKPTVANESYEAAAATLEAKGGALRQVRSRR